MLSISIITGRAKADTSFFGVALAHRTLKPHENTNTRVFLEWL
jgi:hypothetical protein